MKIIVEMRKDEFNAINRSLLQMAGVYKSLLENQHVPDITKATAQRELEAIQLLLEKEREEHE